MNAMGYAKKYKRVNAIYTRLSSEKSLSKLNKEISLITERINAEARKYVKADIELAGDSLLKELEQSRIYDRFLRMSAIALDLVDSYMKMLEEMLPGHDFSIKKEHDALTSINGTELKNSSVCNIYRVHNVLRDFMTDIRDLKIEESAKSLADRSLFSKRMKLATGEANFTGDDDDNVVHLPSVIIPGLDDGEIVEYDRAFAASDDVKSTNDGGSTPPGEQMQLYDPTTYFLRHYRLDDDDNLVDASTGIVIQHLVQDAE